MLPKGGEVGINTSELDVYDQHLMTAVVEKAERAGKKVIPLIVPTNNPLHAVLTTAKDIQANEVIIGASNKFTAEVQLEQVAFYWISMHGGKPIPMTVRILGRDRDVYYDIDGGHRIPKMADKARSIEELRASGAGVKRMLFVHDGTHACTDLFQSVVTMLDEEVVLDMAATLSASKSQVRKAIKRDEERAKRIGREMQVHYASGDPGADIVRFALEGQYEVIVLPLPDERPDGLHWPEWIGHVLNNAHCRVFMAANPVIPKAMAQ
jgi:hypothetical protein